MKKRLLLIASAIFFMSMMPISVKASSPSPDDLPEQITPFSFDFEDEIVVDDVAPAAIQPMMIAANLDERAQALDAFIAANIDEDSLILIAPDTGYEVNPFIYAGLVLSFAGIFVTVKKLKKSNI